PSLVATPPPMLAPPGAPRCPYPTLFRSERPELVFRDPAQVIFIGDAGARLDAPPTPRLQRQAVVGEGMGDGLERLAGMPLPAQVDRKGTRLNSSHVKSSYAVSCWKKAEE